jgi:hypothetical protein
MGDAQRQRQALSPGADGLTAGYLLVAGNGQKVAGNFNAYERHGLGTLVDECRWASLNAVLAVSSSLMGAKVYFVPRRKWLASNFFGSWNTRCAKGRQRTKYRIDAASPCQ